MDAIVRCGECGGPLEWGAPRCAHCGATFSHWPTNAAGAPRLASWVLAQVLEALREDRPWEALRIWREAYDVDGPTALEVVRSLRASFAEGGLLKRRRPATDARPADSEGRCVACGGPRASASICPWCGAAHVSLGRAAREGPDLREVEALVAQGQLLVAIKRFRELTGADLRASKAAVEELARRARR